jgi:hypothetical protein
MIPPRIMKRLAESLTKQTREGSAPWSRERSDLQRYIHKIGSGRIVLHYDPSRGGADTIELAVTGENGEVIGSLVAVENESGYDELADLVFEVQRATGQGMHRAITDDVLRLIKS